MGSPLPVTAKDSPPPHLSTHATRALARGPARTCMSFRLHLWSAMLVACGLVGSGPRQHGTETADFTDASVLARSGAAPPESKLSDSSYTAPERNRRTSLIVRPDCVQFIAREPPLNAQVSRREPRHVNASVAQRQGAFL